MTTFGTLTPSGEVIDKIEVDLNSIPSQDPLAFMWGVKKGQDILKHGVINNKIHGSLYSELAPEYLRGFLFGYRGILVPEGTKIKKGQEQNFSLSQLNTYERTR